MTHGKDIIEGFVKTLPAKAGVYQMHDKNGNVLYVGKAKHLKKRVSAYTQPEKQSVRIQRMIHLTAHMEFTTTHTEAEALLLEAQMIKKLKPKYNILLRDDKSFPYICITKSHDYPLVAKHRGAKSKGEEYFGPFASARAVNQVIDLLHKIFQLRNCSDNVFKQRTRPCMQYQIKRCTAPCVNKVSKEDYAKQVNMAREFLLGKNTKIQKQLAKEMQTASKEQRFEEAATLRDRINYLTKVQSYQTSKFHGDIHTIAQKNGKSCVQVFFFVHGQNYGNKAFFPKHDKEESAGDILSAFIGQFYSNKPTPSEVLVNYKLDEKTVLEEALNTRITLPKQGAKKELIQMAEQNALQALERKMLSESNNEDMFKKLAECFDLPKVPERIEVYDNSHVSGAHALGAMVVADTEGFKKSAYRKFNMPKDLQGDDYAMMYEMLVRRLKKLDDSNKPDLLLIDGGKGQLTAALKALEDTDANIPVVAIAKGEDRNAGRERFFLPHQKPFSIKQGDPLLHFLQRVRDEAHRFAIMSHRGKRSKAIGSNPLDEIPGIGGKRKKALLLHFGSAKAVAEAGISDLQRVEGINKHTAETIYRFFHEETS